MSISSVGSVHSHAHLQWLSQSDSVEAGDASPTDALQSLFQAFKGGGASDSLAGVGSGDGSGGAGGGSCGAPQFSPAAMSALLSVQGQNINPATADAQSLIAKFDTDGDGKISQSEFETAIGSDADKSKVDALFSKLDGDGDGAVSQDELQTALQKAHGGGHRHRHHVEASSESGQQGGDPLQALLSRASADGATSQTSSNADGSTITTITYADGSKLELTTPATSSDSSSNTGSNNSNAFNLGNLLKYMVSLQAKLAPPTADVSV